MNTKKPTKPSFPQKYFGEMKDVRDPSFFILATLTFAKSEITTQFKLSLMVFC